MTRVETIERKIAGLSSPELAEFRNWFITEFDAQQWDRQIQEDATAGELDNLANSALKHFRTGKCTEL